MENKMSSSQSAEVNLKLTLTDLSFFARTLMAFGKVLDTEQFAEVLDYCVGAKEKGKLDEYLEQVYKIFEEGTDLVSSFHYAFYDILMEPGDKF